MKIKTTLGLMATMMGLLQANPVAHYYFGDGNLLDDTSGNENALTAMGSISANADAYSVQIDDAEFYTSASLNNSSAAYTISLWFNPDVANPSTHSSIMSTSGTNDWQLENVAGNGLRVNADAPNVATSTSLTAGTWYHVLFVTNGAGFDLYVTEQGQAIGSPIASAASGAYAMSELRIGVNRGTNLNWEGDYANVKVYDSALDSTAIASLLAEGSDAEPIPLPVINSFSVDDCYVPAGTSVQFSWDADDSTSLVLNPGNVDLGALSSGGVGITSITVNQTTEYTITASNTEGSVEQKLTVSVGDPRPNLIIFLVDDFGISDTSVPFVLDGAGNPVTYNFNNFYQTPNMETLANTGMRFTSAYAHTICSPSRASIMTGRTSARHAITNFLPASNSDWPVNWREDGLDATDVTLPATLQANGYKTIHCGKGHYSEASYDILDLGYDLNIGGAPQGEPDSYTNWSATRVPDVPGAGTKFLTQALADEANIAIEDAVNDGKPFFLYMSFYAVHAVNSQTPRFPVNPNATGDYSAAINTEHEGFATMVEGMDLAVGAIRQKVIDLGVGEDTFVMILGDNGTDSPAAGANGLSGGSFNDYPMRGKKGYKWEGGVRVPFIASWVTPDAANAFQAARPVVSNSIEDDIVTIWDVPVTMLAAAGISNPANFGEDGYDLGPYFAGTPGEHRPQKIALHFPHNRGANNGSASYFSWIRDGDMKLIYHFFNETHELYDLAADPTESNDLSGTMPNTVMSLTRRLAETLNNEWGNAGALKPLVRVTDHVIELPNNPAVDIDGDGVSDISEDTNRNGLRDAGELDPEDDDSDDDTTPDGVEIRVGTDPLDANSAFGLSIQKNVDETHTLSWPSQVGNEFEILYSTDLFDWSTVIEANHPADSGNSTSYFRPAPAPGDTKGFYRVGLKPE